MKNSDNIEENLKIKQLGYCLSLHFASIDNIDILFKNLISNFINRYSCHWIKGAYWELKRKDKNNGIENFKTEFDKELNNYSKLIQGIQTRVIGNILIPKPSSIIKNSESSLSIISFRRMEVGYEILIFSFSKKAEFEFLEFGEILETLEKEIYKIRELLFVNTPEEVKERYYLPDTKFYFINEMNGDISKDVLIKYLNNKSSNIYNFLKEYFCAEGVNPLKIPMSIIDNKLYVIRHHSYYFNQDLSEKFLIMPTTNISDIKLLVKTVDLIANIEFYFTKFFFLIKSVFELLSEMDEKSSEIIDSIYEAKITSLKPEETERILLKLTSLSQELFPKYPLCDKIQAELEHLYNDASHLISNITKPTVYSQALEKPLLESMQGAIETIGIEFQMRINIITRDVPRIIGRQYHNLNVITNLTRSYYELINSKSITKYTKNIRALTWILIILTIVIVFPLIMDMIPYLKLLITYLMNCG